MDTFPRFAKVVSHFAQTHPSKWLELPRFVLLLSLTPFILDLSLFQIGNADYAPSEYLIDPLRFESLSYEQLSDYNGEPPIAPNAKVSKKQRELIVQFIKMTPERMCVDRKRRKAFIHHVLSNDPQLQKMCAQYRRDLQIYKQKLKRHNALKEQTKKAAQALVAQADGFLSMAHNKPPAPQASVISYSQGYFQAFFAQFSLETVLDENADSHHQNTGFVASPSSVANALVLLLIIPAVLVCLRYRAWLLLVFGLSIPMVNASVWALSFVYDGLGLSLYHIDSVMVAQIAFAYFLLSAHLRAESFVIFSLFISLAIVYLISASSAISESELNDASQNLATFTYLIPVLLFVILATILRILIKGMRQNIGLLKELGLWRSVKAFARALLMWTPMAVLCLPFFYLSLHLIPKHISNTLHEQGLLQNDYSHQAGLLDNALLSTAHLSDDIQFVWHLSVEEQKANLHASNRDLQALSFTDTFNRRFEQGVPRSLVFDKSQSDAFLVAPVVNLANDEMKKSMQKAYLNLRSQIKASLNKLVAAQENAIKEAANSNLSSAVSKLEALRIEGQSRIQDANGNTQSSIFASFTYVQAYHQLAMLLFAYLCLKSYLYVFSRVSVNQQTGILVSLSERRSKSQPAQEHKGAPNIRSHGSEILLSSEMAPTFYLSRKFQCRGKAPKLRFTQMLGAPIARIFNGAYAMNEINLTPNDTDVGCSSTQGIEYFEWDLRDGERVVFDYHHFVGISKGVTLSTLISPRFSSLLIGKIIYSQATGPGKLILMAKGRAQIYTGQVQAGSLPPKRMLAMSVDTKLCVESELDILNVYFSEAYIKPIEGDMIIDVDTQSGHSSGLGSFIKHFILPG
ncbi:hypothetical protein ACFO4O_11050 [Glaciecola siphonariae]|uniref:Uncharacterized protein n=1 Tax=Glaciecola siphonariae TaxID=521012 RepID=A0ABV9LWZ0_9ALTE